MPQFCVAGLICCWQKEKRKKLLVAKQYWQFWFLRVLIEGLVRHWQKGGRGAYVYMICDSAWSAATALSEPIAHVWI